MLPTTSNWEHEGTTIEAATDTATGTMGDDPLLWQRMTWLPPQVVCRLGDTLVEHPQNHLQKVLL
jgi:hypothetical protein